MRGAATARVQAPIGAVFAALADLDRVHEWQPAVSEFRCLERDGNGYPSLVRTVLDTPLRRVSAELHTTYTEPTVMRWSLARGDAKAFDGAWTLKQVAAGQTLVAYEVAIDLGRFGMLIRGPAKAAGQSVLSSMPGRLKAFVEGR